MCKGNGLRVLLCIKYRFYCNYRGVKCVDSVYSMCLKGMSNDNLKGKGSIELNLIFS